jgi:hypothetical protein
VNRRQGVSFCGRPRIGGVAAALFAVTGSLLVLGSSAAAQSGTTWGGLTRASRPYDSGSDPHFYVAAGGSTSSPCTKAKPCGSVGRAVNVANHVPYDSEPVAISITGGSFVTHLTFPDQPYPEKSLTIMGISPGKTKLSGAGVAPILITYADAPPITVDNLTMSGGSSTVGIGGGAIHDGGNVMHFNNVAFVQNKDPIPPGDGGAVDDDGGTMTITNSVFRHNTVGSNTFPGTGGAVSLEGGSLLISGGVLAGNMAPGAGGGGGIGAVDGNLTIKNSTVSDNAAGGNGGGIGAVDGNLTVENSTVNDNAAGGNGGALSVGQIDHPYVIGSTFDANTAGGDGGLVYRQGGSALSIGGSVLLENSATGGSTCAGGALKDLGYNIIDTISCSLGRHSRVSTAAAVNLQLEAQNGGPTQTERIEKTSAAHNVVPGTVEIDGKRFCGTTDQRGVPRLQGPASRCDAGAYQYAPPVISGVSPVRGAPGTLITINGYGFDFVALRFRNSSLGLARHGSGRITLTTPDVGKGPARIQLTNPDGQSSTSFEVLAPRG